MPERPALISIFSASKGGAFPFAISISEQVTLMQKSFEKNNELFLKRATRLIAGNN
jgi:hypothetical protein